MILLAGRGFAGGDWGHHMFLILACARLALLHHVEIKRARLKVVVVRLHAPATREGGEKRGNKGKRVVRRKAREEPRGEAGRWYLANAFI